MVAMSWSGGWIRMVRSDPKEVHDGEPTVPPGEPGGLSGLS
jgi:hypothetical protein